MRLALLVVGIALATSACIGGGDDAAPTSTTSTTVATATATARTPTEILPAIDTDLAAVDVDLAEATGALGD